MTWKLEQTGFITETRNLLYPKISFFLSSRAYRDPTVPITQYNGPVTSHCLTLDVLGGKASCDYACGLKEGDNIETVCEVLRNMFEYFKSIRTTKSHL